MSRRIEPRPEDRPEAEIADGAGEMGFFSPGSYWPIGIALSAAIAGLGPGVRPVVDRGGRPDLGADRDLRPDVRVLHRYPTRRRA